MRKLVNRSSRIFSEIAAVLPAAAAGQDQRALGAGGGIGVDQARNILLGLDRAAEQEVFAEIQSEERARSAAISSSLRASISAGTSTAW